jgi:hypothetical protein
MPTLTIHSKYDSMVRMASEYLFVLTDFPDSPEVAKRLRALRYTHDRDDNKWWKRRYAEGCNQQSRNAELTKLKRIDSRTTMVWARRESRAGEGGGV